MVVPVVVARSEGRLDTAVFDAPPQSLDDALAAGQPRVPEPAAA
ncbi:hypothetical protein [Nonomuraea sp. NPDC050783]